MTCTNAIVANPKTSRSTPPAFVVLSFAGVLLEVGWWQVRQLGDLRQHIALFLTWYAILFTAFVALALYVVRRYDRVGASGERAALWTVIVWALVFRLTLVSLTPTLSDDIYRYLWDGRVQLAGVNPYRYAPNDPALASLRDLHWSFINHQEIATIYPPLSQWIFRLAAGVSPTLLMQKIALLLWDVATLILLALVLPSWGRSPVLSLMYAWHPLVITEVAGSGHNDPLGIFWLMLGLWLWTRKRPHLAAAAWGIGTLGKIAPAMMGLWLLARRSRWRSLGWLLLTAGIGSLPFLRGLGHAAMGWDHYGRPWEFNSSLYAILTWLGSAPWLARTLCLGCWTAAALVIARRGNDPRVFAWMLAALAVLCSPVVEPWYVLWLVPFLCLFHRTAWLCFTGTVILSYQVLMHQAVCGVWHLEPWAQWFVYLPLYLWLAVAWCFRRRMPGELPVGWV